MIPSRISIACLTISVAVTWACADQPEAEPPRTLSIEVDSVWSSNPANPDVRRAFGAFRRGPLLLLEDAYAHDMVFLPVVDSLGNTIRRIGAPGDGSGTYTRIQTVGAHENRQVYVFDRQRAVILDSTFKRIRQIDFPFKVERGVVLANGLVVVSGDGAPDRHNFALHVFDDSGTLVRSFDPIDRRAYYSRSIAPGRSNSLWSYESNSDAPSYTIKRWDPQTGQVVQTIEDTPEWFITPGVDSSAARARGALRNAPAPRVSRMWESPDGVLWVLSSVGEAAWWDAPIDLRDRVLDGILEARDAETGRLLATRRFDEYLTAFTEDGDVLMVSHGADERPRHTIVSATLKGR